MVMDMLPAPTGLFSPTAALRSSTTRPTTTADTSADTSLISNTKDTPRTTSLPTNQLVTLVQHIHAQLTQATRYAFKYKNTLLHIKYVVNCKLSILIQIQIYGERKLIRIFKFKRELLNKLTVMYHLYVDYVYSCSRSPRSVIQN